ncbi:MAG TPA: phytanoyl-CoA dioxygenase [Oceanospirillaceae bacterium]|nr:phytanoyl-CoA dioxygenase [Oceanospirillaceae bacterium]
MANMAAFLASMEQRNSIADYPHAVDFQAHIPIYDGHQLRAMDSQQLAAVQAEWAHCWQHQAGVMVVRNLYPQAAVVDAMTEVYYQLLRKQEASQSGHNKGDHFAPKGANGRVWNALEKAAVLDPKTFIDYYSNALLADICTAWLGPDYQLTSQVNLVYPGGQPQQPHRDYHLGFTSDAEVARYPMHVQIMSAMLTLQGAVAHIDMPVESGPTMLLPYSQRYEAGYGLYRQPEFMAYFAEHAVQLPLQKGDGLFFNPALMHAAGENKSADIQRMANLLQISSAFAKPMESLDQRNMQLTCYPYLAIANLSEPELAAIATAISDNYPFPTNLDRDQSETSLRPPSSRDLLLESIARKDKLQTFNDALNQLYWRKQSS